MLLKDFKSFTIVCDFCHVIWKKKQTNSIVTILTMIIMITIIIILIIIVLV